MQRLELTTHLIDVQKGLHVALFTLMMITCLLDDYRANAVTEMPIGFDIAVVVDKVSGVWRSGVSYDLRPPRRLRAKRHPTSG